MHFVTVNQRKLAQSLKELTFQLEGQREVLDDDLKQALRELAGAAARQFRRMGGTLDGPKQRK